MMTNYFALNKWNNFQDYMNHYMWELLYATAYETALEKENWREMFQILDGKYLLILSVV